MSSFFSDERSSVNRESRKRTELLSDQTSIHREGLHIPGKEATGG